MFGPLVVFGDEVIVFSDKASIHGKGEPVLAWQRWYERTVAESIKQLAGAIRPLTDPLASVYVDGRATQAFPFTLPAPEKRRLHLIAVVHPDRNPKAQPQNWPGLSFDSAVLGAESPFRVGRLAAKSLPVHLFDGKTLEDLLQELDTVADFVGYLKRRQAAIESTANLAFAEHDLLALSLSNRDSREWGPIPLPAPDVDGVVRIPSGLWDAYLSSKRTIHRKTADEQSRVIDRLIEHFHEEYIEGRTEHQRPQTFDSHERALRLLASESRFGRRIIAAVFYEIFQETEQHTTWASTVPSRDVPGLRYVLYTYPASSPESNAHYEQALMHHLQARIFVARSQFQADVIIGIGLPNRTVDTNLKMMAVFDGTGWTDEDQKAAERLQVEDWIFKELVPVHHHHVL